MALWGELVFRLHSAGGMIRITLIPPSPSLLPSTLALLAALGGCASPTADPGPMADSLQSRSTGHCTGLPIRVQTVFHGEELNCKLFKLETEVATQAQTSDYPNLETFKMCPKRGDDRPLTLYEGRSETHWEVAENEERDLEIRPAKAVDYTYKITMTNTTKGSEAWEVSANNQSTQPGIFPIRITPMIQGHGAQTIESACVPRRVSRSAGSSLRVPYKIVTAKGALLAESYLWFQIGNDLLRVAPIPRFALIDYQSPGEHRVSPPLLQLLLSRTVYNL